MQKADGFHRRLFVDRAQLGETNIFSSRTLRAVARCVRNSLPFAQFVETDSFEVRRVKEHVFVCSSFNETETLVGEPLDLAFSHDVIPKNEKKPQRCPTVPVQITSLQLSESTIFDGFVNSAWKIAVPNRFRKSPLGEGGIWYVPRQAQKHADRG